MKTLLALSAVLLLAGNLFADPAILVKERAKRIANMNNERQGLPPAYPSSKPAPSPAAPTPPPQLQLTPQQQSFVQLVKDLDAIKPESLADRKDQLALDLMAVAHGANKPSSALARKLAGDLAAALLGNTLSPALRSRLAQDLQAVMGGANYPQSQLDAIIADVPAILKKAGAGEKEVAAVSDDLKAMAAEVKKK
jgi:hypothetical protein